MTVLAEDQRMGVWGSARDEGGREGREGGRDSWLHLLTRSRADAFPRCVILFVSIVSAAHQIGFCACHGLKGGESYAHPSSFVGAWTERIAAVRGKTRGGTSCSVCSSFLVVYCRHLQVSKSGTSSDRRLGGQWSLRGTSSTKLFEKSRQAACPT